MGIHGHLIALYNNFDAWDVFRPPLQKDFACSPLIILDALPKKKAKTQLNRALETLAEQIRSSSPFSLFSIHFNHTFPHYPLLRTKIVYFIFVVESIMC
nr:hypothetical protein Iba_chr06aCG0870 [Ipomoea batatas]